jgi:hypothetical protein
MIKTPVSKEYSKSFECLCRATKISNKSHEKSSSDNSAAEDAEDVVSVDLSDEERTLNEQTYFKSDGLGPRKAVTQISDKPAMS